MSIKVGDTLALVVNRQICEVQVSKVGRKYLYVEGVGVRETKFYLETMLKVCDYGSPTRLYPSIEAYEEELVTERLRSKITFNIRDTGLRYTDHTQLKAIADILGVDYE